MAWLETRTQAGRITYRVGWRENGEKQQQTFSDEPAATYFRDRVTAERNHWPKDFVRGQGWLHDLDSDTPTFAEYAQRTIDARGKADQRTKDDYRRMLRLHINPVIGHIHLDRLDRFQVASVATTMTAAGRKPKTVANVHGLLSSILDDALGDELVRRNVAKGALPTLPDSKDEEMVFLTRSEFQAVLAHLDGTDRDLAVLLAGTGLRWSEATALQVHDIDLLGRKTLTVRRAWKRRDNQFELGQPKTKRSRRTVALSPSLLDMLTAHVAAKNPTEFVFTTQTGRVIRHNNWYTRVWLRAVLRARQCDTHAQDVTVKGPCGCPGTLTKQPGIHSLRHTHASWLIDEKVTLPAIQRRLGHESIQTTIDRYGHLAPEHVDEINVAVDKALAGV
jgi:integrase